MSQNGGLNHRIYVGMHDGVCAVFTEDEGKSWHQGPVTPLPHAASRLSASPIDPRRAFLAAYEAGVYRTDDSGLTWQHLGAYPTPYAHSVLAHPSDPGDGLCWQRTGGPVSVQRRRRQLARMRRF